MTVEECLKQVEQHCRQWLLPGATHEMLTAVRALVLEVHDRCAESGPCDDRTEYLFVACVHHGGERVCRKAARAQLVAQGKEVGDGLATAT